MPGTATYIVYRAGNQCRVWDTAKNSDVAGVGTTPDAALQWALDLVDKTDPFSGGPGNVYVTNGQYDLTEAFQGFELHSYTNLRLDPRAKLTVKPGYSGSVFKLLTTDFTGADGKPTSAGVTNSSIVGGRITERAPASSLWTAFLLQGSAKNALAGMQFNKFAETEVTLASVGISIVVDELLGYVNSNTFEFLRMADCKTFVSFEMADLAYTTGTPVWANRFADLQLECNNAVKTTIGIRNVVGRQQEFDSVKVWDIQRGTPAADKKYPLTMQISDQAQSTLIIGGILAGGYVRDVNVENRGRDTTVIGFNGAIPPE
jgi:hypothetical protein